MDNEYIVRFEKLVYHIFDEMEIREKIYLCCVEPVKCAKIFVRFNMGFLQGGNGHETNAADAPGTAAGSPMPRRLRGGG